MKIMPAVRSTSLILTAVLAGCTFGSAGQKEIDYKSAGGRLPQLELPPDLAASSRDSRLAVPDMATGSTATFLAYNAERAAGAVSAPGSDVLPKIGKVHVERSGNQRWLVVPQSADKVWPTVKEFWQENGFLLKVEQAATGVMETDWAESRANISQGLVRDTLGKFIDQVYATAERNKFRTRLEATADGSTEIYVSHHGMSETFNGPSKNQTVWEPRPSDPELEAELLQRLSVRFGAEEIRYKAKTGDNPPSMDRGKLVDSKEGAGVLQLEETFDRAWRRVGLALDRVGFTVEDRDRSSGFYFVRYVDSQGDAGDIAKKDPGFMSKLMFWKPGKTDAKPEQYRVQVRDRQDASDVQILNKDGAQDKSENARRILSLLHQQLK